ncbi:MAG: Uma2 family endonuclease [Gemmataceae bacterium]
MTPATAADEPLYEVVGGVRVAIPHMGSRASILANRLARLLNNFAEPRQLGEAMVEVLFEINADGLQRRPDIAFVSPARWVPEMDGLDDPAAFTTVPDLAVEIVSPSNTAMEILEKRADYFASGVRAVWIVYPKQRRVEVYSSVDDYRPLHVGDTIDGGDVLPSFQLPVTDLFNRAPPGPP